MKSSSVTAKQETQLHLSSSSPPRRPQLSLQSPELQAEFLQERQNKFRPCSNSDTSLVSPFSLTSPTSPCLPSPTSDSPSSSPWSSSSSSPSPCSDNSSACLSLSSPELLSELKQSRTRSLRHVRAHSGLTTIFSGRGRRGGGAQDTASNPSTQLPSQKTLH